jgi:ribose-phosphate pyrophosphokinase
MTMDLHADQIQGFFDFPVDHIYASRVFLPYVRNLKIDNLSVVAPDMGSAKRTNAYARLLECPMIICHKSREKANVVGTMTAIGDVEGRNLLVLDDMIDTAGTVAKVADMLMDKGALSIRVMATHPVLSGPAYDRISRSCIEEVIVTDTIPLRDDPNIDTGKIKVLSVAELFADVIQKVYSYQSISDSYIT